MPHVVDGPPAVSVARHPAPRRPGSPAWVVAVGMPTVLVGLHGLLYGRWIVDDAAITFAYARSVATGAGPVLQPGAEAVEGYSNPAWLALLVGGRWLGLFDRGAWLGVPDYVAFPKLLALVLVAGTFACFFAVASVLSRRPVLVTVLAGAATAAVPSFVIWTMSGLENSLLAVAATGLAAVLVRAAVADRLLATSTALWCGLLAALAALTRPDGLIYVGAFGLAALLLARRADLPRAVRATAVSLAACAVPVGIHLGWRILTFGEYLPNTAVAKAQGLPGPAELARPAELVGYVVWPAAVLTVVCVGAALVSPWAARRGLVALLVPLALAVAAFGILQPDWMGQLRFATPVWPLGALVGVVAAERAAPQLTHRGRAVGSALAAAAAVLSGVVFADAARDFREEPTAPLCLVAQNTGRAVNGYARLIDASGGSLLAPDMGGAALISDLRLVDLIGLVDSRIARYWAAGDMEGLRDHVFELTRPTFVTSNTAWSAETGLTADPRLAADYVEITTSTAGVTDWVRRDALPPGGLDRLRVFAAGTMGPADVESRRSPRASCGDRLVPSAG